MKVTEELKKKWEERLELLESQGYFDKVFEKYDKHKKITEEITKTDDYINWLEKFTEKYPGFCDNSWLYHPEEISEEDKIEVSKLCNFYEAIANYAYSNFIYGEPNKWCGDIFYIKHNNIGYAIEMLHGQGTVFLTERKNLTQENENSFIDFKLIQESNNLKEEMVTVKLSDLHSLIKAVVSADIKIDNETTERLKLLIKRKNSKI